MGCVQAKPSTGSPPRGHNGMKLEHGYVPSAPFGGPRYRTQPPSAEPEVDSFPTREEDRDRVLMLESRGVDADELVDGWPRWLTENIPKRVLAGLVPKSADSYEKIDKIGQGTYSNVYKARDRRTGQIVAVKKVRFDTSEPESVRFMAREIMILQKLDHPNVIKLEGLATSRMQYSLYLVFDFMQTDLARVISRPDSRLTEPQVKCYMQQLLSGMQHCHERGILHRDIKGSNLLIDKDGMLKIADFGLANYFNPNKRRPLTSRVVTLWYRAPELLLGTTDYGVGIDLWSVGCLFGEMFAGRPIMPGRTEVEQLHRIFKLCGSPSEEYWRKLKLSTSFRPPKPYKRSILETFKDFPSSSFGLLMSLLALDPSYRGSAASALEGEFFSTSPLACDLAGLPIIYKAEKDELNRPRERRKRKKLKLRSHVQKEGQRENEQAVEEKEDESPEEEKAAELAPHSPEPGSSTGSSTSSGVKPQNWRYSASPTPSRLPASSPLFERARRSESRPSVPKILKNLSPLPSARKDGGDRRGGSKANRHGLDKRSASSSGFPRFDESQIQKQSVLVD